MDRDEALKLLKGGEEGIREWNQRRRAGEAIPDLSGANLGYAILLGANLSQADLSGAILLGANLSQADLSYANLHWAILTEEADLSYAKLSYASLGYAKLNRANLSGADLMGANLSGADLIGANLSGADLMGASLNGADLMGASLNGANLTEANLSSANLTEAILIRAMMVDVELRGAKLCDCRIFGISVWNVKTDKNTEQINLIISDDSDPILTVDNLKVAQFIYLLLNNEEIRGVIDTITSKVVLILGRFKSDRKAVLDSLRAVLRGKGYSPILFDFDKPRSRDITETISTLAHMARFIIADITEAKSIPQELQAIVPNLPSVPVQPIIHESDRPYGMFEHFKRYPWVLSVYYYNDQNQLIQSLPGAVIGPAEAKVAELRG